MRTLLWSYFSESFFSPFLCFDVQHKSWYDDLIISTELSFKKLLLITWMSPGICRLSTNLILECFNYLNASRLCPSHRAALNHLWHKLNFSLATMLCALATMINYLLRRSQMQRGKRLKKEELRNMHKWINCGTVQHPSAVNDEVLRRFFKVNYYGFCRISISYGALVFFSVCFRLLKPTLSTIRKQLQIVI